MAVMCILSRQHTALTLSTKLSPHRHSIAGVLSIHELDFDSDIPGRSLAVGEVKALRIDIKKVPARDKGISVRMTGFTPLLMLLFNPLKKQNQSEGFVIFH